MTNTITYSKVKFCRENRSRSHDLFSSVSSTDSTLLLVPLFRYLRWIKCRGLVTDLNRITKNAHQRFAIVTPEGSRSNESLEKTEHPRTQREFVENDGLSE